MVIYNTYNSTRKRRRRSHCAHAREDDRHLIPCVTCTSLDKKDDQFPYWRVSTREKGETYIGKRDDSERRRGNLYHRLNDLVCGI